MLERIGYRRPPRLGSGRVRTARLLLARYRRPLAAFVSLAGLWLTIRSAAPSPPPTVAVTVATHDLPAGHTLSAADLRSVDWPAKQVPTTGLASAFSRTGLVLAAPLRAGELVTDARVIGPGLLAGQAPGTVAVPVRLGDPAAAAILRAGDRVDVLVSGSSSGWTAEPDLADGTASSGSSSAASSSGAERVASRALVLAVPGGGSGPDSLIGGGSGGSSGGGGAAGSGGSSGLAGLTGGGFDPADSGATAAGVIVLAVSSYEAAHLAAAQSGQFVAITILPPT